LSLPQGTTVQYGDTVMFIAKDRKPFIRTIQPEGLLQTHFGQIFYDEIIGVRYGEQFRTHTGHSMYVLAPSLDDFLTYLKRETQIIYPKDLGYIALKLGLRQGITVVEAGSGSGALTCLLALIVGDSGHVYSYERRKKNLRRATANVRQLGLDHRVTFIERDIEDGFDQHDAHALFLDVPNPEDYLDIAWNALQGGGFLGAIVPTANQLIALLTALYHGPWFLLQAEELIMRPWKTIPARVRPDDQMFGHTGILVFARAVYREVRYTPATTDELITDQKPPIE